jgi:two-component system chemotaxis response regulator CheB
VTKIRVLVVDDSAFARKVLRQALNENPRIEVVGSAADGLDALERIAELAPDVVTLDLVMPNLDGIGVLQALGKLRTPKKPRVVVVSMSDGQSDLAIRALREGAIDLVHKPTALATDQLYELSGELRRKAEAAAVARVPGNESELSRQSPPRPSGPLKSRKPRHQIVLVGASTGGPQAVGVLLRALPADFPVPIAVVVHMPIGFSQSLAEHLDRDSALEVREARQGAPLLPGQVLIAQAGMHLTFRRSRAGYEACLSAAPLGTLHRPSLDVTFQSAAEVSVGPVLGIVLSGMGNDGLAGAREIHVRGGTLLTQTERSSVVYGMPRVVWEAGLAKAEADIDAMASELMDWL